MSKNGTKKEFKFRQKINHLESFFECAPQQVARPPPGHNKSQFLRIMMTFSLVFCMDLVFNSILVASSLHLLGIGSKSCFCTPRLSELTPSRFSPSDDWNL